MKIRSGFGVRNDRRARDRTRAVLCAIAACAAIICSAQRAWAQGKTAQSADDSKLRIWLDTSFYTGSPGGHQTQTVIAPVASADFKLGALRLGADLPFAAGWGRTATDIVGVSLSQSASNFVMGNPDLRLDFEVSSGPVLARVGGGVAFLVADASAGSADSLEGKQALQLASASRGTWNQWWWMLDTYTLFVPGELRYRGDGFAAGVEGALALTIPGKQSNNVRDVGTLAQIGAFIAAMQDETGAVGVRVRSVIPLVNRLEAPIVIGRVTTGNSLLPCQTSIEVYGEMHAAELLLLGAGFLLNLDAPFGVFGDGQDIWGARITVGVALD
jgi:hypothetical protein